VPQALPGGAKPFFAAQWMIYQRFVFSSYEKLRVMEEVVFNTKVI
jgi:hypothetical protein